MTDAEDASPSADESVPDAEPSNVQSLTDLFDQMDRAAFKRALANRDALREVREEKKPQSR